MSFGYLQCFCILLVRSSTLLMVTELYLYSTVLLYYLFREAPFSQEKLQVSAARGLLGALRRLLRTHVYVIDCRVLNTTELKKQGLYEEHVQSYVQGKYVTDVLTYARDFPTYVVCT